MGKYLGTLTVLYFGLQVAWAFGKGTGNLYRLLGPLGEAIGLAKEGERPPLMLFRVVFPKGAGNNAKGVYWVPTWGYYVPWLGFTITPQKFPFHGFFGGGANWVGAQLPLGEIGLV